MAAATVLLLQSGRAGSSAGIVHVPFTYPPAVVTVELLIPDMSPGGASYSTRQLPSTEVASTCRKSALEQPPVVLTDMLTVSVGAATPLPFASLSLIVPSCRVHPVTVED